MTKLNAKDVKMFNKVEKDIIGNVFYNAQLLTEMKEEFVNNQPEKESGKKAIKTFNQKITQELFISESEIYRLLKIHQRFSQNLSDFSMFNKSVINELISFPDEFDNEKLIQEAQGKTIQELRARKKQLKEQKETITKKITKLSPVEQVVEINSLLHNNELNDKDKKILIKKTQNKFNYHTRNASYYNDILLLLEAK